MKKSSTKFVGACCSLMLFLFFANTANAQYCDMSSTEPDEDHITNVIFSGIENPTGPSTYSDYTDDYTAHVVPGVIYPFTAFMGNAGSYTETVVVYIDWNQDQTFDEDERHEIGSCTSSGCATTGITGSIEVPFSALPGTTRMRVIGEYDSYATEPCGSITYGEIEDYTVSVSAGECTPPNFDYLITNNCEDETFNVSAILNDFGSNTFVSVAMTRSDGVSVFPVTISSDLPVGYEFELINDVPTGVLVTAVVQSINPACNLNRTWTSMGCYCIPEIEYGCDNDNNISNVSLSGETVDLDNTTGCSPDAYGYFADLDQPDLAPGELYTLSVSTSYYSNANQQAIAWIDYNKDSEFQENEIIGNTNGGGMDNANFDFIVPEGLDPGSYRLRVRMVYGSAAPTWDACQMGSEGETEDYKITIIELDDCVGTPTAGTVLTEDDSYCAFSPIVLVANGASEPANGLSRIWQSSPTGTDTWTDIEGAVSPTFVLQEGITIPTDFRFQVTCAISDETDVSNVIEIDLKPGNECYCIPAYVHGCSSGDRITNVTLAGETIEIDNSTFCSAGGYGDYTGLANPDLSPGETYSISVSSDYFTPESQRVTAWIDYNQNGFFEPDEQIAYSGSSGLGPDGTKSFAFALPDVLDPGDYRLRVRLVYGFGNADPTFDGCNSENYGETEDYQVNILALDVCADAPSS